ncbi:FAD:protein FMN transferase [Desulfovibrio legallii]|uniref:FAD:protein FMN transferase n=1 Tax=Desulfovibrio legallii TaxID=571438 RepID=A0A1G7HVW8_9BACT|nr:FAD:protein FMN transferase [Desulfovibrio legallii]SDF04592.1 thiamine biosynthesis lipoprotein [Desulfovibrio legallii]
MPRCYSRRDMLRAALLGGGLLGAAPLLSLLTAAPVAARTPALATDAPLPESRSALFMGTLVTVSVARATMDQAAEATARAFALGRELEKIFTRFTADAPLGQVNAAGRLRDVPPRLTALLRVTADMHRLTDGAFDPTVLPLVTLLENSRENPAAFSAAAAREALALVGMERLRLDDGGLRLERQGMALTLDGIAKGHIADAMSRELSAAGCPDHCVNAGGDIVARGRNAAGRPWRIGVEDPRVRGRSLQVLELPQGGGVATSGVYEAFYDAAHARSHLINPATGQDAAQAGVTVAAPDGCTADALATAFSVLPPRQALALADSLPGCACCLVRRDGLIQTSRGWSGTRV